MFNLEEQVTDLSDSKLLKEHGIMEGIPHDGHWRKSWKNRWKKTLRYDWTPINTQGPPAICSITQEAVLFYRLDKLLAKLPKEIENDGVVYLLTIRPRAIGYQDPDTQKWLHFSKSKIDWITDCVQLLVLLAAERSEDKKEGVE